MSVPSVWKSGLAVTLMLLLGPTLILAQADQQVQYTAEEYDAYQQAVNVELEKRDDAIIGFIKQHPNSGLMSYAVTSYLQLLQEYQSKGQPQNVLSAAEKLLPVKPDQIDILAFAAVAAYQLQGFSKAAEYGEKVYAEKPSAGLAFILANSYGQLKNNDKYVQYGEKAWPELSPKDCYQILGELTRIHASRSNWNKATQYAKLAIEAFEAAEKPPQTPQAEWDKYVKTQRAQAYAVLGAQAAMAENWNAAATHSRKVLEFASDSALIAEAYLYIGRSHWAQNKIDSAMEAFAKGSVQRGAPNAKPCRQYLERLYRSTHNDSLAGIEEYIQRAAGR